VELDISKPLRRLLDIRSLVSRLQNTYLPPDALRPHHHRYTLLMDLVGHLQTEALVLSGVWQIAKHAVKSPQINLMLFAYDVISFGQAVSIFARLLFTVAVGPVHRSFLGLSASNFSTRTQASPSPPSSLFITNLKSSRHVISCHLLLTVIPRQHGGHNHPKRSYLLY